jgi:hypothetical protein
MKKLFLISIFLLSAKLSHAVVISVNTPVGVTNNSTTYSSSTLVAQTGGNQNCINNASLMSTTVSNMSILDGSLQTGTTLWQMMSIPANTIVYPISSSVDPHVLGSGEINAICSGPNSSLVVQISSGTKSINYNSFIRR